MTSEFKYNGAGTGVIAFNNNRKIFAVGERTVKPRIHIYSYQNFQLLQTLHEGTTIEYNDIAFSRDGAYLASLGSLPDHKLILWDWEPGTKLVETDGAMHSRFLSFNPRNSFQLCTSGASHLAFWTIDKTIEGYQITPVYVNFNPF